MKRLGLATLFSPFMLRGILRPTTSAALREKVMLAVTAVNDCRYCAWIHTHLALNNGIELSEVNAILAHSDMQAATPADAAAILYAQHYADTNGRTEASALAALQAHYSPAQVREIKAFIHAIYIGNLAGNTFDALLARFKGMKVENSSILFEILCALLSSPLLLIILIRSRFDKTVALR